MATDESRSPRTDPLDVFVANAAEMMLDRMYDGGRKFGMLSWRTRAYTDDDNEERLDRACEHLHAALVNDAGPDELAKRAADVANQAFMLADPKRRRHGPVDPGYGGPTR